MSEALSASALRFARESGFSIEVESLDVRAGEIHALIGPNGSGKSTLLRLLPGILHPDSGRVSLDGCDLATMTPRDAARHIAFLPQESAPAFATRALDVVLLGRHPWNRGLGLPGDEDLRIAGEAMQRMRVDALAERFFDTLSGGERQRVLLASILAQKPRVILLDEPTAALDIHHQIEVFRLLREEAARGAAILVATHDLTLAGHFADRVTLLQSGRVVRCGKPEEVLREELLRGVYGGDLRVIADPGTGAPCVIPNAGPASAECGVRSAGVANMEGEIPPRQGSVGPARNAEVSDSKRPDAAFKLKPGGFVFTIGLFALACLVAMLIAPVFGAEKINMASALGEYFSVSRAEWHTDASILALRLPRVVLGFLAGVALGGAGAAFQSALRNPLAEPYTLGIASTASLGAVIALGCPAVSFSLGWISGTQVWAFAFAVAGLLFLQVAARSPWGHSLTGLLLAGFTMGLVSAALIMLLRFLANPNAARAMDIWMVGGLEVTGWRDVTPSLLFWVVGVAIVLAQARALNQVEMGGDLARGRGVDAAKVTRRVLAGGSLAAAAVVAVAGPIGFVGLLVPHMVRRIVGSDVRVVIPCSMLGGAAVLVLADATARSISLMGRGAELPVGILTSLVGGPVFLILLLRRRV